MFARLYNSLVIETFLNPWFYVVLAVALLLERLTPARPQRVFSGGLRGDFAWIFLKLAIHATILAAYVSFLRALYNEYLGFLTMQFTLSWPVLARGVLALLITDLVFYVTHVIRHRISAMWHFHAIHHSQTELNFFSEYRVHPIDDIFIVTLAFIPTLMFEQSFFFAMTIVWVRHWHTRFYHCNIKTNLGFLKYILVTPQSHRVHHSSDPRHANKNFGLTFSIWDHLFGTQYRNYEEYPETGVSDSGLTSQTGIITQLMYPFKVMMRSTRSKYLAGHT